MSKITPEIKSWLEDWEEACGLVQTLSARRPDWPGDDAQQNEYYCAEALESEDTAVWLICEETYMFWNDIKKHEEQQ